MSLLFTKSAARYNSQPAMPQGQQGGFGNMNRTSGMFPFTMGTNFGAAANAAQQNPNPLAQVKAPQQGLATAQGIGQMVQKTARAEWLSGLFASLYPLVKHSEVATGGSSAPAASSSGLTGGSSNASMGGGKGGLGSPVAPMGSQPGNQAGQQGQMGGGLGMAGSPMNGALGGQMGGQVGAFGVVRPGWNTLRPSQPALPGVTKQASALPPVPGTTANMPVPQPGMPPTPSGPQIPPPGGGAPVPMGMGQGSVDPVTGQPIPPPGGQPQMPPQMPPQGAPPGAPQMMPPQGQQPPTAPMQDPMPQPLPANPRMLPPRPATPNDTAANSVMGGLGYDMDAAARPTNAGEATEDMQSEALAMGSKTAASAWRRPEHLAAVAEKVLPRTKWGLSMAPNGRLDAISQLRAVFRGDPALPGVSARLGGFRKTTLPHYPSTPAAAPTEVFRGHRTPDPGLSQATSGGAVHASPYLDTAAGYGKVSVPGHGEQSLVSRYPVGPGQTYHPDFGIAGGKGYDRTQGRSFGDRAPGEASPNRHDLYETDVRRVQPNGRFLTGDGAGSAAPAVEVPAGRDNDAFLRELMRAKTGADLNSTIGTAADPYSDPRGFVLRLMAELGQKRAGYTFSGEDCPKCGASMEGDPYNGCCNSCQHAWGEKTASTAAGFCSYPSCDLPERGSTGLCTHHGAEKTAMDDCYANGCSPDGKGGCTCEGRCESCNPRSKSAALSLTADEGGEDAPAVPGSPMRGWQWKVLQKEQDAARRAWVPRLFRTGSTPLTELLASPGKQGLLGGLAGGALGGAAGGLANRVAPTGQEDWQNALLGGGLGAVLGGFKAYGHRRRENDKVTDALRRTPPGATVDDYEGVQLADSLKRPKTAGMVQDGEYDTKKSAVGESTGLTIDMDSDRYATGKEAWKAISTYQRTAAKKNKVDPEVGKHAMDKEAGIGGLLGKVFGRGRPKLSDGRPAAPGFAGLPAGAKPPAAPVAPAAGTATKTYAPPPPPGSTVKPQSTQSSPPANASGPAPKSPLGEIERNFPELARWLKGGPRTWSASGLAGLGLGAGGALAKEPPGGFNKASQVRLGPTPIPPPVVGQAPDEPDSTKSWAVPAAVGGASLLGLAAVLMRKKKSKVESDEPVEKYAGCTDFARGFFEKCDALGMPLREGVEKVGSDFGEEATRELRDGLEKVAKSSRILEFGRGLFGVGSKGTRAPMGGTLGAFGAKAPAMGAATSKAYQGGQYAQQALSHGGGRTLMGAGAGGLSGNDLGAFGNDKSGPMGMNANAMAAGAMAFNPFMRRQAGRFMGGYGAAPLTGLRSGFLGSFGGSTVDTAAGAAGYDTKGQFGQLGGKLGFGYGALRQGGRTAAQNRGADAPGWLTSANRGMIRGEKGVRDFAYGTIDPLVGAGKAMIRKPIQWASGGKYSGGQGVQPGQTFNAWGAMGPSRAVRATPGRIAGRVVGGGTLGAGALGMGYGYVNDKIDQKVDDTVGRVYNEAMPQISDDVAGMLDQYMGSRGMLDPRTGQFDPSSRMVKNLGGGADEIFRAIGMDPSRLSSLQKVMILGGAVGGGGGLLAGSPVLAGMGGTAAMAGLLPQFMPNQGQQQTQAGMGVSGPQAPYSPGRPFAQGPVARNEWTHQGGGQ